MRATLAVLALLPLLAPVQADEPAERAPEVSAATLPTLVKAIRPSAAECAWGDLAWRPSFGAAVAEARATGKPVLLWAMNGHPLACT